MDNKQQLKKRIQQAELQIKKLNMHTTDSEVCEDLYNSLQQVVITKYENGILFGEIIN